MTDPLPGVDEQQVITFVGNPNGGDWLLGFMGEMCDPPLKYNANGPAMTHALEGCSTVGEDNVKVVKRTNEPEYDVFFLNDLGQRDVPLLDVDDGGLNRGSVTVEVVTEGMYPGTAPPPPNELAKILAGRREANAQRHQQLLDRRLAAVNDKRMALAAEPAVPAEKRPL